MKCESKFHSWDECVEGTENSNEYIICEDCVEKVEKIRMFMVLTFADLTLRVETLDLKPIFETVINSAIINNNDSLSEMTDCGIRISTSTNYDPSKIDIYFPWEEVKLAEKVETDRQIGVRIKRNNGCITLLVKDWSKSTNKKHGECT
jgi:hypothetical protein